MTHIPNSEEIQELFRFFEHEAESKQFAEHLVTPLYRAAKDSERARACAGALIPQAISSLTAAGADVRPMLKVLMYGFALGLKYSERHGITELDPEFGHFLKGLETDLEDE